MVEQTIVPDRCDRQKVGVFMRLWKQITRSWQDLQTTPYDGKYKFEKLSLTEEADISVYEDAINFAFANSDVRNIAISGAYGSGKSSILASYKKKYPRKKFLHISLAHFRPDKARNETDDKDTSTTELEGKILNQLIHQLDAKDIPQTNFRVKNTISLRSVCINAFLISALVICFLHLTLSDKWVSFVSTFDQSKFRTFLEVFTHPYSFFVSGCTISLIGLYFIYSSVKAQRYKAAVRKLSLQGNEIELFEDNNDSFFDKYLNEVLYLFENADIDAVVYEDMDRYEMEAIFERLREVNTLVNIRLSQKGKRVIRFIYLLRDDIFISKDRTKFFDYIIPIVPVVDSSNSYDQLTTHLDKNKIRQDFSDAFLQGISLYIDDMRLLKNICNEYLIYYSRLGAINLSPEKLLAIITYKNIFPRDFAQLQNNLGYVHAVFARKPEIIKAQLAAMEKEHRRLTELMEAVADEVFNSKIELMRSFAVIHFERYQQIYYIQDASAESLDSRLRRTLSEDECKEYDNRIQRIEYTSELKRTKLYNNCKELEQKILDIKGKRLYEIIPHEDGSKMLTEITWFEEGLQQDFRYLKESQHFDLLKYLILNGYLDESYPDYMTYFYPNSLTRKDKIFLRKVLDRNGHDYTYSLDNPHLVTTKLRVSDFDYHEILNNSLLNYLLQYDADSEKLHHLLAQLEKNRDFKFIRQFLEKTTEKSQFIQCLNNQWPGYFRDMLHNSEIPPNEIREFSLDTLYYCDEALLAKVNSDGTLVDYISTSPNYLQINDPKIETLIAALKFLDLRFQSLDPNVSNQILLERVYQESLYRINIENIILMLRFIHGITDGDEQLRCSNYSFVCRFPESPLFRYIDDCINEYLDVWLSSYDSVIIDEECYAIKLLNHQVVSVESKKKYIARLHTIITDLHAVQDTKLWSLLLNNHLVSFREENIIAYWSLEKKTDNATIDFINRFRSTIDFSECLKTQPESLMSELFASLLKCDGIANIQYESCIVSLGFVCEESFNITGLSVEKVQLLARNRIIQMTPASLRFLRNNYPDAVPAYIDSNLDAYIGMMNSQLITQNELLHVLDLDCSDDDKKKLIDLAPSSISIVDKKYSSDICVYILQKKLQSTDLQHLYTAYNGLPYQLKDFLFNHALKNIDAIIRGAYKATIELKCRILASGQLGEYNQQRLLTVCINATEQSDAKLLLDAANKQEFSKIFNPRAKPKIEKNAQCKEILDIFKNRGWITSYSLNTDSNGYDIQRPAPAKKSKRLPRTQT